MLRAALLLALLCAPLAAATGLLDIYSVVCSGGPVVRGPAAVATGAPQCKVTNGRAVDATAWAEFDNSINVTGWTDLRVHGVGETGATRVGWRCYGRPASRRVPMAGSSLLYYAMGFLEGYLTSQMMCDFTNNYESRTFGGNATLRDLVVTFVNDNREWAVAQAATNTSTYWQQVSACVR